VTTSQAGSGKSTKSHSFFSANIYRLARTSDRRDQEVLHPKLDARMPSIKPQAITNARPYCKVSLTLHPTPVISVQTNYNDDIGGFLSPGSEPCVRTLHDKCWLRRKLCATTTRVSLGCVLACRGQRTLLNGLVFALALGQLRIGAIEDGENDLTL
jgi:hypothetical protein